MALSKFSIIDLKVLLSLIFMGFYAWVVMSGGAGLSDVEIIIAIFIYFTTSFLIIRWKGLSYSWLLLPLLLGPIGIIILAFIPTQIKKKDEFAEHS